MEIISPTSVPQNQDAIAVQVDDEEDAARGDANTVEFKFFSLADGDVAADDAGSTREKDDGAVGQSDLKTEQTRF